MRLLLILLCAPLCCLGQSDSLLGVVPIKGGKIYYTGIIETKGTKAQLYSRAKRWVATNYQSAKDVIQLDDPENGELIVKGSFPAQWKTTSFTSTEVEVNHTLTISVKDGKYRYVVTDFVASGYDAPSRYTSGGTWRHPLEGMSSKGRKSEHTKAFYTQELQPKVAALIESLSISMSPGAEADW